MVLARIKVPKSITGFRKAMDQASFNPDLKFVRPIGHRGNGMIEFEFAIAEPELFVELLLPASSFSEFCTANHVTLLEPYGKQTTHSGTPTSDWDWRLRDATTQRFK